MDVEPISRAILVVDIERSSDRDDSRKAVQRDVLYRVLLAALDVAGLTAEKRRIEDRGDGALVVVDSEVLPLLHPVVDEVVEGLRRYNASVGPLEWMRLRLGIHFGLVARDAHGWVGEAVTTAFRIVNGAGVKAVLLGATRAQSIVAVSDAVHGSVVRQGFRDLRPENYGDILDDGRRVWVRVPGYSTPPLPAAAAASAETQAAPTTSAAKTISINAGGNVFTADTIAAVDARVTFGSGS